MDCLSNLCMLRAGICFVTVSSLLCLYYLGAWPLTYMICSAPKKKSYIWLLWEYLFLYPSFSQWCPLLRCICICFWRDYSFTSHRPTQSCFLLGMGDSLFFLLLNLSMLAIHALRHDLVWRPVFQLCAHVSDIFPMFFLLCSCLYLIPRLLSWVPVSCAVPLFLFLSLTK